MEGSKKTDLDEDVLREERGGKMKYLRLEYNSLFEMI